MQLSSSEAHKIQCILVLFSEVIMYSLVSIKGLVSQDMGKAASTPVFCVHLAKLWQIGMIPVLYQPTEATGKTL